MQSTARRPRDLDGTDLVLSHFSLARHHPLADRIDVAAAAGFAGIGLYLGDYRRNVEAGLTPSQLRDMLGAAGICLAEIEVLSSWATRPPSTDAAELEALAWHVADEFECRYLQAIGPVGTDLDTAGRRFGDLCDRAADHGLVVGLEFLPFTDIGDLSDALTIVETAARPNGGLCLDIWHVVRSHCDLEQLRRIPGELVTGVQMSDGTIAPAGSDYRQDCLDHRVPPGDGEFDVDGFVAALAGAGVDIPWSLEVCNAAARETDPHAHVQRCADAMRALLARTQAR